MEAIPLDKENKEAVIMIGDTGVGKSTIMSFLAGSELVIRFDGLKPILDTVKQTRIKIGH
jgi:ABC-type nitrate/sulfonate/bicarbonate transport system ATPase subunit